MVPDCQPLAVQMRSGRAESVHHGHLAIVDAEGGVLVRRGTPEAAFYVRSAVKPLQVLPLLLSGAADAFGLTDAQLAVAVASHSGQDVHVLEVAGLLAAAGLAEAQLQCGVHVPYHAPTAEALTRAGRLPTPLHCNCSGKHAGMLAACRHMGWPLESYREAAHPLQVAVREAIAELGGISSEAIGHGVDGCGLPVWHLPLVAMARAMARLATPEALPARYREAARRVIGAMGAHPLLVAGEGRLDTDLLAAAGGRYICKIGGEGVHVGALVGQGLGWAIKVADGNRRAIGPALARALEEVGHPLARTPEVLRHTAPVVKNNRGEVVGALEPGW